MNCLFCDFVANTRPYQKIYETDTVLAFLDKFPIRPGHALVIPKKHVGDFIDLDDDVYLDVQLAAKKIAATLKRLYDVPRVGIAIKGFDIDHVHVHVIPMKDNKDVTTRRDIEGQTDPETDDNLESEAGKIRASLL
jgi:histidine triad (HIT) family protein